MTPHQYGLVGLIVFFCCVVPAKPDAAKPFFEQNTLFENGEHGYHCFRIPALVVTRRGTILAFAEARKNNCNDHGDVDLALKRSVDSGQTWSDVTFDDRLPEPSCQGSVIRFTDVSGYDKNRILLSTPANPSARSHLTVRVSYDECNSWPVSKVINADSSAYSDLAIASDQMILLLYEADAYSRIVLARFNIEWLSDGTDHLKKHP